MAIKVLIVDDSSIIRQTLTKELAKDPEIEVLGNAMDPYQARDLILQLKPDVITLDIEMPKMDGLTFLQKLMQHHPIPVVIVSSLTQEGSETALQALACGAVDVVCKPGSAYAIGEMIQVLLEKIKVAAQVNLSTLQHNKPDTQNNKILKLTQTTDKVLVIGASTGGTKALEELLVSFPENAPATLIVQHMPKDFTNQFARRLNSICKVEVKEAQDSDRATPGRVLIAPGDFHLLLGRDGAQYIANLREGPAFSGHKPSVDLLFNSAAKNAGKNCVAVILTGMGRDGAKGMKSLFDAGAYTIAQDEKTCVVFGMPKVAIELGGIKSICPLPQIAEEILTHA